MYCKAMTKARAQWPIRMIAFPLQINYKFHMTFHVTWILHFLYSIIMRILCFKVVLKFLLFMAAKPLYTVRASSNWINRVVQWNELFLVKLILYIGHAYMILSYIILSLSTEMDTHKQANAQVEEKSTHKQLWEVVAAVVMYRTIE